MSGVFITGSGTDVGKTFVTAAMIKGLRLKGLNPRGMKPVISGVTFENMMESDSAILLDAVGQVPTSETIEIVSPWRFEAPLSPDMAAAREGKTIDLRAVVAYGRAGMADEAKTTLIEGVGGVMVPLNSESTVLDWIDELDIPAILVVGSYLGTISHTLTALEALKSRDIPVNGIVISESEESPVPLEDTKATIARFAAGTEILIVERGEPNDETCIELCKLLPVD